MLAAPARTLDQRCHQYRPQPFATLVAGTAILLFWGWGAIRATDWANMPPIVWFTLVYVALFATAATVVLLAAIQVQVRAVEEPYLLAVHGDAYRDYAARVGRFVPRMGRTFRQPPR